MIGSHRSLAPIDLLLHLCFMIGYLGKTGIPGACFFVLYLQAFRSTPKPSAWASWSDLSMKQVNAWRLISPVIQVLRDSAIFFQEDI